VRSRSSRNPLLCLFFNDSVARPSLGCFVIES
jgi:hypothetical protein